MQPTPHGHEIFNVLVIYADQPAARDCVQALTRLVRNAERPFHLHPEFCPVATLEGQNLQRAIRDGVAADLVIIAANDGRIGRKVEQWFAAVLPERQRPMEILFRLGSEEAWRITLEPQVGAKPMLAALRHDSVSAVA